MPGRYLASDEFTLAMSANFSIDSGVTAAYSAPGLLRLAAAVTLKGDSQEPPVLLVLHGISPIMTHILIVEDEAAIADTIVFALQQEGFTTHWLNLANQALDYARTHAVDLVILDVGLPDLSGFEACKNLRRFSDVPVLFLTARSDEVDRIVGLEIGADDYVTKPFSPREVAARVRAILKRTLASKTQPTPHKEFQIDQERLAIHYYQQALLLTRHEFHLLSALITQPERVLSREQLLQFAGVPAEVGYERNIDSHIKSLRAKLKQINPDRDPIQTHRGFGYSYQPDHR